MLKIFKKREWGGGRKTRATDPGRALDDGHLDVHPRFSTAKTEWKIALLRVAQSFKMGQQGK